MYILEFFKLLCMPRPLAKVQNETLAQMQPQKLLDAVVARADDTSQDSEKKETERKPHDIRVLVPLLQTVFSHLNHLSIEYVPKSSLTGKDTFAVTTVDEPNQDFVRRVFHTPNTKDAAATFDEREKENLPVFRLHIQIGENFNIVTDLPKLIASVEQKHNSKMKEYNQDSPMVFIDTSRQLQRYWEFMSDKLSEFIVANTEKICEIHDDKNQNRAIGETILLPTLQAYQQLTTLFSEGFANAAKENTFSETKPEIDTTPYLEIEWNKTQKILTGLLERLTSTQDQQVNSQKRLRAYQENPTSFLLRLVGIGGVTAQEKMLEQLHTQARIVFFHHCEVELYRKTSLGRLLERIRLKDTQEGAKDDVAEVVRNDPFYPKNADGADHWFVWWIYDNFPGSQQELTNLQNQLTQNKAKLTEAKANGLNEKTFIQERKELQRNLAGKLCSIIYSKKLFAYKSGANSFSDAIEENQVNCMLRAELFHQLWAEYAGESSLAALAFKHFYAVIQLADKSLLSVDAIPQIINPMDPSIYEIGNNEKLYQAALLEWKADKLVKLGQYVEAEIISREVMRLCHNPDTITRLAKILLKDPTRYAEAEILFKEAMRLDPNNPWFCSSFANFLQYYKQEYATAMHYYSLALKLMKRYPEAKNFLTKAQITERINELKKKTSSPFDRIKQVVTRIFS